MGLLSLLGSVSLLVLSVICGGRVNIEIYGAVAVIGVNVTSGVDPHDPSAPLAGVGLQRRCDRAEM